MSEPAMERPDHAGRRGRALARLGPHDALLLASPPPDPASTETGRREPADPELYYLSGWEEPGAALLLRAGDEGPRYTLFVPARDPDVEAWTGARGGPQAATGEYGADAAHPLSSLPSLLPGLLEQVDRLYYRIGSSVAIDQLVPALLAAGRARRPRSGHGPHTIADPGLVLDELRLLKEPAEIARLRHACAIAAASFRELGEVVRPGAGEWEIEAALEAGFRRRGACGPAFPTIVGAGANATVLHYTANRAVLAAGDVVLVDGGARAAGYCSDITRCYPAGGRFTPAQHALYDIVRRAHAAAVAAARPGEPVSSIHDAALGVLVEGMVALGLLAGDPAELVTRREAYRRFYPHRTSHWLGLDVHDAGDYLSEGRPRPLQPGMVLTVEPGLYIPADAAEAPAELRGTGIRLEDDVLVTDQGPEVLTAALTLDPDALFDRRP